MLAMLKTGGQVVDIAGDIDIAALKPTLRVALRSDSYTLHKVLPNKVDPLVSLMMVEKVPDSTYEMVGGLDKQIKEIKEVIELPVKHPELFEALGIAQPKGVLLYGPPGTGKTLLARAVAHHTDCKFIRVSGSELVQKYIGEGSRMVRELFVMAREHAPSIIFMDEIDSIGSSRGESGSGGGDSEVQRTMLELLNQLDGFESTKNIKVIMATNRIGLHFHIFLELPGYLTISYKISLTRRCCAQGGSTARSSFHRQDQRRVLPFFGSIHARFVSMVSTSKCSDAEVTTRKKNFSFFFRHTSRCPFSVVSIYGHLPRRWDSVLVRRSAASAPKPVRICLLREICYLLIR